MSRLRCLLFLTLTASACAATPARGEDDQAVFRRLRALVEQARGLRFKRPVPTTTLTPAAFKKLNWGGHEPGQEEPGTRAWRALGLIPRSLDVGRAAAANDTATVGGFYIQDPGGPFKRGSLVLVRRPGDKLLVVSAHELLHALHDQRFDLTRLGAALPRTPTGKPLFDAELALNALEEGTATLLGDQIGRKLGDRPAPAGDPSSAGGWLAAKAEFPYSAGRDFAAAVRRSGGLKGLDRAYAAPPRSTEQVLHPERYLRARPDLPSIVELPSTLPTALRGWRRVEQDDLGEFGWSKIVGRAAAAGWDGDRYQVLRHDRARRTIVVAHTTWDTVRDATEFRLAAARSRVLLRGLSPGAHLFLEQRGEHVFFAAGVRREEIASLARYGRRARVRKRAGDDDTWAPRPAVSDPIRRLIDRGGSGVTLVRRGRSARRAARIHTLTFGDRRPAESDLRALAARARRSASIRRLGPGTFRLGPRRTLGYRDGVLTLRAGGTLRLPRLGDFAGPLSVLEKR